MKEAIRQRLNFYEIVSRHVDLKPSGPGKFKGLSPFAKEKTPSFYVDVNKQVYYCFSSKQGGDVFDFLMKVENLSFNDVLKKLADETGVELNLQKENKTKDIFDLNNLALNYFRQNLAQGIEYFKNRGLNDKSIANFSLGFAPGVDGFVRFAAKEGMNPAQLLKAGLASEDSSTGRIFDRFKERLIFPIRDYLGRIIAFGGRVVGDAKPKYLNSPETDVFKKSQTLYGLDLAKNTIKTTEEVIIVEGYLDVIAMHQMGFTQTVATLGTALTEEHGHLLARLGARKLNLLFDNDEAGQKATLLGLDQTLGRHFLVKAICLPSGKDPADLINSPDLIQKALENGLSEVEFRLNTLSNKFNGKTLEGKRQIVAELLPSLRGRDIFDAVANELRRLTADRLGLEPAKLNKWIEEKRTKSTSVTEIRGLVQQNSNPELELAKLIVQNPNLLNKIDGEADFEHPLIAEMVEMIRQGRSTQEIFGKFSGKTEARFLFESVFATNSISLAPDQEELAAKQVVSKTRETKLKAELAMIKAKLAQVSGSELTDLLRQCSDLQRSIEAEKRLRIRN